MDPHFKLLLMGGAVFVLLVLTALGIGAYLLVTWLCGDDDDYYLRRGAKDDVPEWKRIDAE